MPPRGKPRVRFVKNPAADSRAHDDDARRQDDHEQGSGRQGGDRQFLGDVVRAVPRRDSRPRQASGAVQGSAGHHRRARRTTDPGRDVSRFAADYKINYPIVPETQGAARRRFPGIYALPTTFMVGPDLKMMQKHIGQIRPAQIELETRVLAKLPVDAEVEYEPEDKEAVLASNAQATEIPGVDLAVLTAEQKTVALKRLNDEPCGCGCGLTIASAASTTRPARSAPSWRKNPRRSARRQIGRSVPQSTARQTVVAQRYRSAICRCRLSPIAGYGGPL